MNIQKQTLKTAVALVRDSILTSIDDDALTNFSGSFEFSMEYTIRFSKRQRIRQDRITRIAAMFAAIIVTSATVLAVNIDARGLFFAWLHDVYERQIVVKFHKTAEVASIDSLGIGWIPDGYVLIEKQEYGDEIVYLYSHESGSDFIVSLMPFNTDTEVGISSNQPIEPESVVIDGKIALFIDDEDPENDVLTLFDEERGLVITINGALTREEMTKVVQNVH